MNPIDPIELLSYLLIEEGKREVMSVVLDLIRLDQRLCDIALCLPVLSEETSPRWDPRDPVTVAVTLHSTIAAVREGELRRLMQSLRWAAQQTPLSLWLAFGQE